MWKSCSWNAVYSLDERFYVVYEVSPFLSTLYLKMNLKLIGKLFWERRELQKDKNVVPEQNVNYIKTEGVNHYFWRHIPNDSAEQEKYT